MGGAVFYVSFGKSGRQQLRVGRACRDMGRALFKRLAARGYRMAVASMTLPNEASVGLHRAMGFEPVGTYQRIGWKRYRPGVSCRQRA